MFFSAFDRVSGKLLDSDDCYSDLIARVRTLTDTDVVVKRWDDTPLAYVYNGKVEEVVG